MVNVEPRPGVLWTVMSPPIKRQKRRLIASPRPVPPYLRVVEASACAKSWNNLAICCGVMPMPLSRTCSMIVSLPDTTSRKEQHFAVAYYRVHRRAQLVAHVGEEL